MFKKHFKISNSYPLSNKDKKNLKDSLIKYQYDPEYVQFFLNDKNYVDSSENGDANLYMDKVQGSKLVIYSRNNIPYLFCQEPKQTAIFPSAYLLFHKIPQQNHSIIPLKIYLKEGVQKYIFNGADLMWPGIFKIEHDKGFQQFSQGDVAVIYALNGLNLNCEDKEAENLNYVPIATGEMLLEGEITDGKIQKKGKACQINHYVFDELWNMGNRKMPQEVQIQNEIQQNAEEIEEQKQQSEQENEKKEQIENEEEKEQNESEDNLSQAEWDQRVEEAFKRTLLEAITEESLPMEPSDFQKILNEFVLEDQQKIDLKKSSYKKIGKLLECMSDLKNGKGLISYTEDKKKGHKLISKVYQEWKADFVPSFRLKRIKKKDQPNQDEENKKNGNSINFPKVHIEEAYQLGKHIASLNEHLQNPIKQNYYTLKDVRELIIQQYINENNLEGEGVKKGNVKLDPIIVKLIGDIKQDQKDAKKEFIFKNINVNLLPCYTITLIDEDQIVLDNDRQKIFKGDVPLVEIIAQKVNNKNQTTIQGLEIYMIDFGELSSYLQNKCASSASINEIEGKSTLKNPKNLVKVQGQQIKAIEDILVERYKIPKKYIKSIDNCGGKKKK